MGRIDACDLRDKNRIAIRIRDRAPGRELPIQSPKSDGRKLNRSLEGNAPNAVSSPRS